MFLEQLTPRNNNHACTLHIPDVSADNSRLFFATETEHAIAVSVDVFSFPER